jgi:hypothetical protein
MQLEGGPMRVVEQIAVALVVALACSGCKTTPPLPPDAYEPNDTLEQARPLEDITQATINEGDAPDMYFFTLVKHQRARLVLTWTSNGGFNSNSPELELFNPLGKSLGSFEGQMIGKPYTFRPSTPPSDLQAFPPEAEFIVAEAGKYTVSITSVLTECPPEVGCPYGRSTYELKLEIVPNPTSERR